MVLQIILADILLVTRIFPRPCGAQKNTTQLVKYPRVLSVKPSNIKGVYIIQIKQTCTFGVCLGVCPISALIRRILKSEITSERIGTNRSVIEELLTGISPTSWLRCTRWRAPQSLRMFPSFPLITSSL